MSPTIVLVIIFFYIILLFSIAKLGDKQQFNPNSWTRHTLVYALALGVYCTSWTFYGLVGTAAKSGWFFLPILLGPILLFTVFYPLLERVYTICRQEHIHSIADFIASRYGKRQAVAGVVSIVVLVGTIPYIALQLKAVSDTLLLILGDDFFVNQDLTFILALCMIAFTLLFGVNRLDMSGYHSGLMSVIAFESLVKLIALLLVAGFAIYWVVDDVDTSLFFKANNVLSETPSWSRFFIEMLIAMCSFLCLPRMFHITFVECLSVNHLRRSRWIISGYFVLIILCVFAIAWAGNILFFGQQIEGDTYVIAVPLFNDSLWLVLVALLGGFSAATAMIIVATITLSQMLSNDVILPLLRRRQKNKKILSDNSKSLIIIRRTVIVVVVMAAYQYQIILTKNAGLTSIGLISFALIAQLAPSVIFGLYWRKANVRGMYAGLTVGLVIWFYVLMIPLLVNSGVFSSDILERGLLGLSWLRPQNLFGFTFSDELTRGFVLSLGANIALLIWYSLRSQESLSDRIQGLAFTRLIKVEYLSHEDINFEDLKVLLTQFLGRSLTESLFQGTGDAPEDRQQLLQKAEQALAGVVGVASAQSMIKSAHSGNKMAVEEVFNLFGDTTRALRFNQEILSSSFEHLSLGIIVVDEDLKIIGWNNAYEEIFEYPSGMLRVGLSSAEIVRFNARRGLLGQGDPEALIRKRLSLMAMGKSYSAVRFPREGLVLEIKGQPLPNGGYITTYDDITQFMQTQRALESANANLEARVYERTQTIETINQSLRAEIEQRGNIEEELRQAKITADTANASKTKFLALASHDIMQPLNAATLYTSALINQPLDEKSSLTVRRLKDAIDNTESIISTLFEVSKLDSGAIQPQSDLFSLNEILSNVVQEARIQLPEGLSIRYCPTSVYVYSDKRYLRRIVQNFISNAVKYTGKGKIVVGCRRVHDRYQRAAVEICVIDNGMGISEFETAHIFDDFYRVTGYSGGDLSSVQTHENNKRIVPGIGLGLSVVARFGELLNHTVHCRSELRKGSCFSVVVPLGHATEISTAQKPVVTHTLPTHSDDDLNNLHVVYVDDELQNLTATKEVLSRWQCRMTAVNGVNAAREFLLTGVRPDILIMDYQLDSHVTNGLELADELLSAWSAMQPLTSVPVCLVSASLEEGLADKAKGMGYEFLSKPIKPARLRAWMTQVAKR